MINYFIRALILSSSILFFSCSLIMPKTRVLFESSHGMEVICPPERVQVVCGADGAEGDDHGWSLEINVLNDQGMVEQFVYSRSIPYNECVADKKIYAKILGQGKMIYIAGMDEIAFERKEESDKWTNFSGLGRFEHAPRFYTFMVMKNEKGDCLGQYKKCPVEGKDFYIRNSSGPDHKK